MSDKYSFKRAFLCGVALGALSLTGAAFAQGTDTDTDPETEAVTPIPTATPVTEGESRQDKITVTGSLLGRNEYTSSSPIQVITADTATLEGLIDTAAILQSSSVASGSTQINGNFGGFVVEGGTGVNTISLRGLGAQRSLVLFNGRRLGPAGTQGQVGAVDLNVIPDAVINRIEILKDGASSIYGSDAVAGVVNVITRRSIDAPELNFTASKPFKSGGESYGVDGAFGLNFDAGSIVASLSYEKFEPLEQGQRSFLGCPQDYIFSPDDATRRDLLDTRPDGEARDGYLCFNALSQVFDDRNGGRRWVFDNALGGFRPRAAGVAGLSETPSYDSREDSTSIIPETERASIYLTADYDFGPAAFFADVLFNKRKTEQADWRQFFPFQSPSNPTNPTGSGFARPIVLIPFDTSVEIDYFSATAGLRGDFGSTGYLSTWDWELAGVYSKSDGTYTRDTVPVNHVVDNNQGSRPVARNIFDATSPQGFRCEYPTDESSAAYTAALRNGTTPPALVYVACPVNIDYFTRDFIYGNFSDAEAGFLLAKDTGNTIYDQTTVSGLVRGELFKLPAGPVGIAVGAEYREFSINDTPGFYSANNLQWGLSSAVQTEGSDKVTEVFTEIEVPLLAGQPLFEDLTLNVSGRYFDYDSYGSDSVYKGGINWQISPTFRLRSTYGTSYRAPALYELFLGDLTSFLGQSNIDPCNYTDGPPANANIAANCAAAGLTGYIPFGSSALITTGGGAGNLDAETSEAFTLGFVVTPTFADLSIALDYFEIEINDQVAQLGSGSILSGCYASPNYPNEPLCTLFERDNDPSSPRYQQILGVSDNYVNINSQSTRGLDITARYEHETSFGDFSADVQGTWTFEDQFLLFSGEDFEPDDFNGTIGDPDFTANARVQFARGDWRYNWFSDFVSRVSNDERLGGSTGTFSSRGPGLFYFKQYAEPQFYHGASIQYRGDKFAVTFGVNNLFDETPPSVSTGSTTRRGIVPLVGTQYDYRGRSGFLRVSKSF